MQVISLALSLSFSHSAQMMYDRVMCCGTVTYRFQVGEAPENILLM